MILTTTEIVQLLSSKGFSETGLIIGSSIVLAESGGDTEALGHNVPDNNCPNGSLDRGIWQFNSCYHEDVSNDCAYNADCSTEKAYEVSKGGTDFHQWSTFTAGAHRRYVPQVMAACIELGVLGPHPPKGSEIVSIEVPAEWVHDVSKATGVADPLAPSSGDTTPPARTYTVESGDSLFSITEHYTGDGNQWPHLYSANSDIIGPDPNIIQPGQVLTIPADWPEPSA